MSGIFISYAKSDRAKAQMLAAALERQGWSVWWDLKIPPGKTFDEVIKQALDKAKCVIVLWSQTSVRSNWVRTEATVANRRGILIPVLIDDKVDIPLEFLLLQAARLTDWQGQPEDPEFVVLRSAILELLGDAPRPQTGKATQAERLVPVAAPGPEVAPRSKPRSFRPEPWHLLVVALLTLVLLMAVGAGRWLLRERPLPNPQGGAVDASKTASANNTSNLPGNPTETPTATSTTKPPAVSDTESSPPRKPPSQANRPPATSSSIVVDGELTWTRTDNGKGVDWDGANKYCNELTLRGLSGWRLPTIDELAKLNDPEPGEDHMIRKPMRLTAEWVWSSTKRDSGEAFLFTFWGGYRDTSDVFKSLNFHQPILSDGNTYDGGVRALCVRASGK